MGVLDGQAVSAAITNPAFINNNLNDVMPNILGMARALSGASIADVQATLNKLYAATGASESLTGTVYNATAGTIANGNSYQTALTTLAGKFSPATGHFHSGAAGDGPILPVVLDLSAGTPVNGHLTLSAGPGITINQSGNDFLFSATGGGGGGGTVNTFTLVNNQSSFADITGFLFTPASGHAFVAETSTERYIIDTAISEVEDTSFYTNLGTGFNDIIACSLELSDTSIILVGDWTTYNGNPIKYLLKLNADGTENTTFTSNLGTSVNTILYYVAQQADTKILVVGDFTSFNGNSAKKIVRLSSSGVEDSSFTTNVGTGFDNSALSVAIQADQKIIVSGAFVSFNGSSVFRLARLNTNGTEDTAFTANLGTGFDSQVYHATIQADQKILACGQFTDLNGNTRNSLVRLNTNGTEDTAFYTNLGSGFNTPVDFVLVQPDQSILVGGSFSVFNGNTRNGLVRLNPNGTEDTAFYTNLGSAFSGGDVLQISLQSNGAIVLVGIFTTFNGNTRNRIVRLNSDGTEDTAFYTSVGSGFNAQVFSVSTQANDQLLIGGNFTTFNGNSRIRLIRYLIVTVTTTDLVSQDTIKGVYHAATGGWTILDATSVGDMPGVMLQMTSGGQMQYTTTDIPGTIITSEFKFEMVQL